MKITRMKVCGLENPMGFGLRKVKISWNVEDFTGKYQENAVIQVAYDPEFKTIAGCVEGKNLTQFCQEVAMKLSPRTCYYCRIFVTADNGEEAVSDIFTFETGKMDEPWQAKWICTSKEDTYHPIFFTDFKAGTSVTKARIYICGLGGYEAYMNGKKIGDEYLAPFYNDYDREVQYQTYDVKELLGENNRIEIYTGNGWYKGHFGLGYQENIYGDHMAAIAEIHVDYGDGTHQVITTDGTWKYKGSDVESSGIYDAETLNRLLWESGNNEEKAVCLEEELYPEVSHHLADRFSAPVRVCETLTVKEVITTPAGETVLDFGQNFAGYVAFKSHLPKGARVELSYGEVLQQGNFYNENYRQAVIPFVYISDGREETVRPHFTFFGGRYVRVAGWPAEVALCPEDFTGCVVHTDLERTGFLETSDASVNQLISNCLWGQRSNFLDVPTDCPQRNERLGWTGDAQVFAPTASYNMDTRAFYDKYMHDLRVAQEILGGSIPHYAPMAGSLDGGSSVWGDSATFIPTTMYEYYGDKEMLETYYPLMKDWVDWITRQDVERGQKYQFDFAFTFGDWLALDGMTEQSFKGSTDDAYVSTCYYYASTRKVAQAARILGKEEDARYYEDLADHIRQAILDEYFTKTGRLAIDSQTAYMVALNFGIWTDKERLIDGLKKRLDKDAHKIKGGFVGATMMCRVLAENGLEDEAWFMLFNHDFPGWLHCVDLGATTIWERWNSLLDDGSISGTGMNSLNHYSYGSVLEYIYRDIAGIAPAAPGFAKAVLAPQISWQTSYMKASYKSASGTWVSNWKIEEDGKVTVHMEVPFNCTAKVILPGYDGDAFELEAGSFDKTYTPVRDFRQMFTMNSRLSQMANCPEAMEILKKDLPAAAGMIQAHDIENMNLSLNDMLHMPFLGIPAENIKAAGEKLSQIKAR